MLRIAERLVSRDVDLFGRRASPATASAADTRRRFPVVSGCARSGSRLPGRTARPGLPGPPACAARAPGRARPPGQPVLPLGALGRQSARRLRLPVVAVYRTDVPGYARAYHWGRLAEEAAWRWLRGIHNAADRTLVPSTASAERLAAHGVQRIWMWGRGVDVQRFSPAARSDPLRRVLAPGGEILAGYVGRLAAEKQVGLLAGVAALPGCAWSWWAQAGRGPAAAADAAAVFLGQRRRRAAGPDLRQPGRVRAQRLHETLARPSRRRRPAACPWWPRPRAARSTWSRTGSPATWSSRGTRTR